MIIVEFFNWIRIIFIWMCMLASIYYIIRTYIRIKAKEAYTHSWVLLILSVLFLLSFIIGNIFFRDEYNDIISSVSFILFIISTQIIKYQDRKAGRRWWTQ